MSSPPEIINSTTDSNHASEESPSINQEKSASLFPKEIQASKQSQARKYWLSLTALVCSLLCLICSIYVVKCMLFPPSLPVEVNISSAQHAENQLDSSPGNPAGQEANNKIKISIEDQKISQGDTSLKRDQGRWTLTFRNHSISFGKKKDQQGGTISPAKDQSEQSQSMADPSETILKLETEELSPEMQLLQKEHGDRMENALAGLCTFLFLGAIFTAISYHQEKRFTYTIINIILLVFSIISLYYMVIMSIYLLMLSLLPLILLLMVIHSIVNSGGINISF